MIFPGDFVSLKSDTIAGQQLDDLEKRVPWSAKISTTHFHPGNHPPTETRRDQDIRVSALCPVDRASYKACPTKPVLPMSLQ